MRIIFLGVGEAFDEEIPNTSILILSKTRLLLDCGYSVPRQLWKYNPDKSFLDGIFISHRHADHHFGIPPLLVRMLEEKRTKQLTIFCQRKETIQELIEYGYPGFSSRFGFKINYVEVEDGQKIRFNELTLEFAPTNHSASNLAIKVHDGKNAVCYSGDGMFNEKTERIYKNSDLLVHESYILDKKIVGHACITDLIRMAEKNNVKCLALTHIQRDFRKRIMRSEIKRKIFSEKVKIIIPSPLAVYSF
jgi:ribonuclease BN (tRNA processing enzyme)